MARPTNKQDLISIANIQLEQLEQLIESIETVEENMIFNFSDSLPGKEAHWLRDKNVRDVLIHLYGWQQLLLKWVKANQMGMATPFLPEKYNWKTYGDMNIELWQMHQNISYQKSKAMLKESHQEVMKLIASFSNEELFSKGLFSWTGGSTLGQYCISTTSSHYEWAKKKIKAHLKRLNTN